MRFCSQGNGIFAANPFTPLTDGLIQVSRNLLAVISILVLVIIKTRCGQLA